MKKMKQLEKGTRFILKSFSTVRNGRRGRLCVSHPVNFRQFSSSAVLSNVYSSHLGDLKLEQKPLGQFMLERFEKYGDKVALVSIV